MTTGLDLCLYEWWKASDELVQLIPAERVSSEVQQINESLQSDKDNDGRFDDCVVFQVSSDPHWRTNSSRGWRSQVTVSVLSVDYDRSKNAAQRLERTWDASTFTGSGSSVTYCRSIKLSGVQDEETGIWDHTVTFTINHNGV